MTPDYRDSRLLFRVLGCLKELNLSYYIAYEDTVMCRWGKKWLPYHEVMILDKRLQRI